MRRPRRHRRPRGTGTVWKDPRNKNRPYVAVAADGTRIGSFATAGDAVQMLDRVNASQAAPERLCYTLSDVYDRWSVLHYPKISKSAQQSYRNAYNKAEPLHRRRIAELKTEDYQTIIQQIADAGGSRSLCEKQRQLFSQLCQYAIHQDIIHTNYATALSLPSPGAPKTRVLSAAEVSAIWGMANDSRLGETAKIALVLVYTGMRLNELLTVRRDDVHLAEGYLIGGEKTEKVKVSEYLQIIRENKPMQRLMIAGAGTKLALSIANNTTVLCMLYGCMMGAYDGLYLPMMVLGYACSVPFFILSVRTSQKKGQKASLTKYVSVALACYVGVLVLLLLWGHGDAFHLSLLGENGLSINLYTILFILFFGIGYGAYYATADMPIPMVADCSDYETYRSGKYIPGIMGTLFSLVDKLVSSLSATVVGIAVTFIGLNNLPTQYDPYTPGMNVVVIVLFCAIPMVAWAATLIAMKGYSLTGEKMKEIQAVNACRRDAVANGMKLEDAMEKWQTVDQLPAEYRA